MFCHECGKELDEQSLYCPNCGAKRFQSAPNDTSPQPEPQEMEFDEVIPEVSKLDPMPSAPAPTKSKMPLYFGIGGVLVVIIIAIIAIFASGGKESEPADDTPQAAATVATADYFQYFDMSAGQFIRETGLELTFQDGSNIYSGYDGNVELSNGDDGIDYFKMATDLGGSSILGVSVGMSTEDAAAMLQKNGLYEVKTENNHTVYKEQNGGYTLDVGFNVTDDTVNSVTYKLEAQEKDSDTQTTDNNTSQQDTSGVASGDTYNYYYYNVPYAPERDYKYSSNDGYLWPTDRYYISTSDLANYTQDEVAAIRNEIYARHGYVFKTDKWSAYFNTKSWYTPNSNYSNSMLSSVEQANINTIVKYESSMGWK